MFIEDLAFEYVMLSALLKSRCELCRSLSRAAFRIKSQIQEAVKQLNPEFLFSTPVSLHQDDTFQNSTLGLSTNRHMAESGAMETAKITEGIHEGKHLLTET